MVARPYLRTCSVAAVLLAALGTARLATAQVGTTRPLIDPVPFEWATTAVETGFPVGYPGRRVLRYQQIHDGTVGRQRVFAGVAFRRAPGDVASAAAFTAQLELRLSTSPHSAATLSSTFAANVGTDEAVVTSLRSINFPATAGPWDGTAPFDYVVPADTPFPYLGGGPLCVELRIADHTNNTPLRFGMAAEGYSHVGRFGSDCGSLMLDARFDGLEAVHELSGMQPGTPALLLFGQEFNSTAAGPLPIDLTPLGAPGCSLGLEPLFDVRDRADASGRLEVRVPIDALAPGSFYGVQAAAVQPGVNALGLITSQTAVLLPQTGRAVGRVWAEDLTASRGLRQPVFGLVLQLLE